MYNDHTGLRSAAVFALGGLFTVLAVGLALLASGVYRAALDAGEANSAQRTALSFLVNQVRRADEAGSVALGTFGGADALRLTEEVDGTDYYTYLYCLDGQLMELYTEAGSGLQPRDGTPVLPVQALQIAADGGLLRFTVTAEDGAEHTAALSPRTGFEEVGRL